MPDLGESCVRGQFRWGLRSLLVLAWAIVLFGSAEPVRAQSDDQTGINREYAIKAAYLYQFGRYVQWPSKAFPNGDAPLVIGVLGENPFGTVLEEIARTKRIDGRQIIVRQFANLQDYSPCHILFLSASLSPEQKAAAIKKARKSGILIVGEEPGFAEQGGMVNFFVDENRVRFEINVAVASQEQLKISSKLLSLAKIVR
jgi:hypothetical protein